MSAVHTKPKHSTGRGALTSTVSALGLVLAVGGGVAFARSSGQRPEPPPAVVEQRLDSYVVGPAVHLDPTVEADRQRGRRDATRAAPAAGRPERLVVPRLGVDAPVVGIDAPGGVLRPPSDPQVLGWWRDGAPAGAARGSAIVTGHTVSTGGGAFDDLETLVPGDAVSIGTPKGVVTYAVKRVRIYRKATLAQHAAKVFSQTVPGRLVLVTCEDWNGRTFLSNAVVVSEPVA